MNKRSIRQLSEILIAVIVAIGLAWLGQLLTVSFPDYYWVLLALFPLVLLTLRHGGPAGIIGGALAGIGIGLLEFGGDWLKIIVLSIIPFITVGLAGFFSKYTQKTLNNRRLSSTYLNIYTATLLVILGFTLLKAQLLPLLLNLQAVYPWDNLNLWLSILLGFIIIGSIISIIAKTNPTWIIPKRSKYLSRHETSSLLND